MTVQQYIEKVLSEVGVKKKKIDFEIQLTHTGDVADYNSGNLIRFTIKKPKTKLKGNKS